MRDETARAFGAVFFRRGEYVAALLAVDAERLFADRAFAGVESLLDEFAVRGIARGDDHRVGIRFLQHLLVVGVHGNLDIQHCQVCLQAHWIVIVKTGELTMLFKGVQQRPGEHVQTAAAGACKDVALSLGHGWRSSKMWFHV